VILFFILTFVVAWLAWGWAATLPPGALATALLFLGTFAPGLVALAMVARERGRRGLQELWERVIDVRAPWQWYAFAIGYYVVLKLLAAVMHRVVAGAWPVFGTIPLVIIVVAIVINTPFQMGEEVGWRGYALPRLAARLGYVRGSLLLGVAWGVWHLPLFYVAGLANYGQAFWQYVFGSVALSVAMAWLFVNTRGSVGLAMLMHSAVDQTRGIVPTRLATPGNPLTVVDGSLVTWLVVGLLGISMIYFLVRLRGVTPPTLSSEAVR